MSRRESRKKLGGELVYSGLVFDVVQVYDESLQESFEFALADDSVRAYPVYLDGNLWLASERRAGLGSNRVIRAASGSVGDHEDVISAALREAHEELGVEGGSAVVFHESTTNLKLLNTITHVLIRNWSPGQQQLERAEEIDSFVIPLREVPGLVWSGGVLEDPVAFALLKLHQMLVVHEPHS
jgi:8-oxo-dGTP pyrophosphatase MutT (NUDIX family)